MKKIILVGAFLFSITARAELVPFPGTTQINLDGATITLEPAEFARQKQDAVKRSKRTPSSSVNYENAMSDKLKELRAAVLSVQSAAQLDAMLEKLNAEYNAFDKAAPAHISSPDRDYRYYAAELLPLRCLKGFAFRFSPLAESSRVVDSRLATMMMNLAQEIQVYSPRVEDLPSNDQAEAAKSGEVNVSRAAFDYISQPYDGAVLFSQGYQLQQALINSCYAELDKSAARIARIDLSTPIVWDNKMAFGIGAFPDDLDRYKLIGEAERHVSLASKHLGMHVLTFFRSYSINDYFTLQTELVKLYVEDAFPNILAAGFLGIEGVDLKKRAEKVRSFKNTFLLYQDGPQFMKLSYQHLARGVQELNLAWAELKDKSDNHARILNPAYFRGFDRQNDAVLSTWSRLSSGAAAELRSKVTGKVVTVDLHSFYMNPPNDLKVFLPTQFSGEDKRFVAHAHKIFIYDEKTKGIVPADHHYSERRNYYFESAQGWDLGSYRRIFPGVQSADDITASLRVMNQAWGGKAVGIGFIPFFQ